MWTPSDFFENCPETNNRPMRFGEKKSRDLVILIIF
jgi:hypothetical protein